VVAWCGEGVGSWRVEGVRYVRVWEGVGLGGWLGVEERLWVEGGVMDFGERVVHVYVCVFCE
jgi:hypothetical protein